MSIFKIFLKFSILREFFKYEDMKWHFLLFGSETLGRSKIKKKKKKKKGNIIIWRYNVHQSKFEGAY